MNLDTGRFLNRYGVGGIALIGLVAFGVTGLTGSGGVESSGVLQGVDATVYKSPNCGCCGAWAQYAERQGMNVEVKEVRNLNQIKGEHGVPSSLESCHTTVLSDYVVEGHIPAEGIEKLLEEEPDVQGIGLPGMPQGSPGMPGPKQGEWEISSFTENGGTSEFMTV
jgi:hypothetical protein